MGGTISQLGKLLVTIVVVCGVIIGLGTMFPDGELGAGAGELGEGLVQLFDRTGEAFGGAT